MEASEQFKDVAVFTGEPEVLSASPLPTQLPMMRSQTQYHTAISVQKPRDLDKIQAAVLREAEIAGDAFYYSWPVKDKRTGKVKQVTGPSIGLAMAAAREWTNCAVPVEYQETPGEWVFTAHFVDLEKGFTVSRVFRRRKGKGFHGGWGDDRAEDMTFQAAQSRAIRNVITAGVPRWLIDRAIDKAKEAVIKGLTGNKLAEAIEKASKFLTGYGISDERVVAVLGVPKTQWAADEIIALRGMVSQLKDGQASADTLFPPIEEKETAKPAEESKPDRKPRSDKGTKRGHEAPQDAPEGPTPGLTTGEEEGTPQPPPQAATSEVIASIRRGIIHLNLSEATICQEWEVSNLEELDQEAAGNLLINLIQKSKEPKEEGTPL